MGIVSRAVKAAVISFLLAVSTFLALNFLFAILWGLDIHHPLLPFAEFCGIVSWPLWLVYWFRRLGKSSLETEIP